MSSNLKKNAMVLIKESLSYPTSALRGAEISEVRKS